MVFTLSLQITKTSLSSGGAEGVGRDHAADASREQSGRGGEAVLHAGVWPQTVCTEDGTADEAEGEAGGWGECEPTKIDKTVSC